MVHCNYASTVASSLSAALGKSGRPIQDELLTVSCKSEAMCLRGEKPLVQENTPLPIYCPNWSSFVNEQNALHSEVQHLSDDYRSIVVVLNCYRPLNTDFPTFG
jgi:hypothetical protein